MLFSPCSFNFLDTIYLFFFCPCFWNLYHPEAISREVAELAPGAELVEQWKEGPAVAASANRVIEFLQAQTP